MKILLVFLYLVAPIAISADSFEILRNDVEGFAKVVPGKLFDFPADHGPHFDYRIEWWYLTANLKDQQGNQWGIQWTLFRNALSAKSSESGWSSNQLWMAHAAISAPDGHSFEQRFARGGIGQAGVNLDNQFEAWIDDWVWRSDGKSLFPAQLKFRIADRQVDMRLSSNADWVLHDDKGYSQKSEQGQASYYYSQPKIEIVGTINGQPLSGSAWLDREWSSQPLAQNQRGWDWFSLHLSDGNKLMLYRLRHEDGNHWLSGSWVDANGNLTPLSNDDIRLSEKNTRSIKIDDETEITLPLDWLIELPEMNRQFIVKPLYDQQWMETSFPYWEGVVLVEDESGMRVGEGYMELTGYQPP